MAFASRGERPCQRWQITRKVSSSMVTDTRSRASPQCSDSHLYAKRKQTPNGEGEERSIGVDRSAPERERTRKALLGDRFGGLLTEPEPMVPVPSACDDRVVGLSLDRVTRAWTCLVPGGRAGARKSAM